MASSGNDVHVVWSDDRDGNSEIYYRHSSDAGITWGAETRLTNAADYSFWPSVSVSGIVVHLLWEDHRDGDYEIYYKRSTDSGNNWGVDTRLTNSPGISNDASVSASGSAVHVVWKDSRDGYFRIYYKRSTDNGISWSADSLLTLGTGGCFKPSVSASGTGVHVSWQDNRDGLPEIYYTHSTDGGINWAAETRLTNDPASSDYTSVAASGSLVHVIWEDNRNAGHSEIFYKRSTDGGTNWSPDTMLTSDPFVSRNPFVTVSGSTVHVVWQDNRDDQDGEIYYKRSTDGGISWGTDVRLTNALLNSQVPSVSASGSVVHVVWQDNRDGNFEIYYKRNPTGNPAVVININSEVPNSFSLSQNYPNPFNPATNIKFSVPTSSFVKLVVYDIAGRGAETLVNENLKAGTYEVNMNAAKYSSGVYFYKLTAGDFVETKKMVLVK